MTNEELKTALISGEPVMHGGSVYTRVSGVVYRRDGEGGIYVQAELLDQNANSVTMAAPHKVTACGMGQTKLSIKGRKGAKALGT